MMFHIIVKYLDSCVYVKLEFDNVSKLNFYKIYISFLGQLFRR